MSPDQIQQQAYQALSSNIGNVGTVLRKARVERGITQKEMSEMCGFSESTVSRIEWNYSGNTQNVKRMFLVLRTFDMFTANQQHHEK